MKKTIAPISKRIAGAGVSGITQKQCARCSAKVKKDAFCPHCRKFFQELSKLDPALATTVHGAKRHSPPSDMSRGRTGKLWISCPPDSADPDLALSGIVSAITTANSPKSPLKRLSVLPFLPTT